MLTNIAGIRIASFMILDKKAPRIHLQKLHELLQLLFFR